MSVAPKPVFEELRPPLEREAALLEADRCLECGGPYAPAPCGPLETADMLVVTVRVPTRDASELSVSVYEGVIHVRGPRGFGHDVPLPAGADVDRLHAGLFHDVLELRAPRGDAVEATPARTIPVRPLF